MLNRHSAEIALVPLVKQFRGEFFPDCLVILHSSVFYDDDVFPPKNGKRDQRLDRKELKTNPKTASMCEVTPDYGIYRKSDVVRLCIKRRNGQQYYIYPNEDHFETSLEFAKPIPYMAYDSLRPKVPKGKVMLVLLKKGANPVAVVDHKGGKTYNLQSERVKVLAQARRFGAGKAYILTEKSISEAVNCDGEIAVKVVKSYRDGTIWKLLDMRQ
jgi:hypothetical protein